MTIRTTMVHINKTVHVLTKPVRQDRPTGQSRFILLGTKISKVDIVVYLVVVAVGSMFHSSTPVDAPTARRLLQ